MKSWLQPKWRIFVFLLIINLTWMVVTWTKLEPSLWTWIIPFALSINFVMVFSNQLVPSLPEEPKLLAGQDPWGALKIIHLTADKLGLTAPKVFLLDTASVLIYSYGRTPSRPCLFISRGAIERLSLDELEAVITYQLIGIQKSFHVLNYWLGSIVAVVYRLGDALESITATVFGFRPKISKTLTWPVIWILRLCLIDPKDYFGLDQATVRALNHSESLAKALWKMEAYAHTLPTNEPWTIAHMCMVSPLASSLSSNTFQPSLKVRLTKLTGDFPI